MNDVSVASIRMPQFRTARLGEKIAKDIVFKLLARLEVGSLTVHEAGDSYHFGAADNPISPCAEVHVQDSGFYAQLLKCGSIAAGEAYIQGRWASPDLVAVIRLISANMAVMEALDAKQSWLSKTVLAVAHSLNRNTKHGSRENISAHYDLGNEFFELFLDSNMMYSSAIFEAAGDTLEAASETKLDEICRQLDLKAGDSLLEIGTGWGGMAIHAAKHYGVCVTSTTISKEQYEYAKERVKAEGLQDKITLLLEDYRDLTGQYDRLVSIEMIEAVGHEYYKSYFARCSNLLKPNGKMVLQSITVADQRYTLARDAVDYIKRYIFPGGCLPSVAVLADHVASDTNMQIVHLRDITADYAETLSHWRRRFLAALDRVAAMGFDQQFMRMWEYYLCYCEGGFRERIISTVQVALAKPGYHSNQRFLHKGES